MNIHSFWSEFPALAVKLERVDRYIENIYDESPPILKTDLETLLLNPGKMLRPAFFLLSSTGGEKEDDSLYSVAAALEILHTATLVHDDIIDGADLRRGQPTVSSRHGVKRAVLVGDYLLARALELASAAHNDVLVETMNRSVSRLCLSEIEQDMSEKGLFIGREEYFRRIRGKTAELFGLSCQAGALLGGAGKETAESCYHAGRHFGMAFQIDDDILDYRGDGRKTGKRSGSDLREGVPTLPLIMALEEDRRSIAWMCRSPLRRLFSRQIRKEIIKCGYDVKARTIADEYRRACLDGLAQLNLGDGELFKDLIITLSRRNF